MTSEKVVSPISIQRSVIDCFGERVLAPNSLQEVILREAPSGATNIRDRGELIDKESSTRVDSIGLKFRGERDLSWCSFDGSNRAELKSKIEF